MRIQDLVQGIQSPAELFMNAVSEQARYSEDLPYLLTFAPLAQMNPFQRLLYCRAHQSGYAVVPTVHFENLASVNWKGRSVIHLHWVASVLTGCTSTVEAKERISAFEQEMLRWRRAGHAIVWTLHNVLPHNTQQLLENEIALRKVLVEHCDLVHILSEASVVEAKQYYDIPEEKVFFVPHPSYEGWYANVGDPVAARLDLGIEPDEFAFVQFGSLQPYKGVLELIQAFKVLKLRYPERRFRLIIAGNPSDKAYVEQVLSASMGSYDIRIIPSAMQEKEIQTLFNAADIVVAPYVKTLNSGVSLLAATFKKPLVAPNAAGVLQTFSEDSNLLYNALDEDGLLEALDRSLSYQISPEVFEDILNRYRPAKISKEFFEGLNQRLFKNQLDMKEGDVA
ncbi:MAG: glycosyltransferase family 4 protein [Alcaligenaceae bacterium]|nr:glycosyltransferase family 4 protein [Alcaligenaceae bacterium]